MQINIVSSILLHPLTSAVCCCCCLLDFFLDNNGEYVVEIDVVDCVQRRGNKNFNVFS
jgi:hypothetical protein